MPHGRDLTGAIGVMILCAATLRSRTSHAAAHSFGAMSPKRRAIVSASLAASPLVVLDQGMDAKQAVLRHMSVRLQVGLLNRAQLLSDRHPLCQCPIAQGCQAMRVHSLGRL